MYLARSGLPPEKKDGHVAAWKSACGRMAGDLESMELPWTFSPTFSLSGRASNLSRTMWLNMRIIEPPVLGKSSVSRELDFLRDYLLHVLESFNDFGILFRL
jgi:hypothetical protein